MARPALVIISRLQEHRNVGNEAAASRCGVAWPALAAGRLLFLLVGIVWLSWRDILKESERISIGAARACHL